MQPVAAPLTYADAVRRLPQPPYTTRSQPAHPAAYTAPWAAAPVANPWRTPDNRPICYACFTPGHVARYCHRRPQTYGNYAGRRNPAANPSTNMGRSRHLAIPLLTTLTSSHSAHRLLVGDRPTPCVAGLGPPNRKTKHRSSRGKNCAVFELSKPSLLSC
uniref:CCHC-type domain-containing protein n=1 Tax=Rhipicephalus microplus TaxID=6941 RepID=A0A6G5AFH5_RHIMP